MESMDEFHDICETSSALVTGGGKGTTEGDWTDYQGTRDVPPRPLPAECLEALILMMP